MSATKIEGVKALKRKMFMEVRRPFIGVQIRS